MFEIKELIMYDFDNNSYIYKFEKGINYFIGKNNSGKTEFYKFIDYMFGSSDNIKDSMWYKGTLQKSTIIFSYNQISYRITRILSDNKCFFSYEDEDEKEAIDLNEYKDRLQAVFSIDSKTIEQLHKFTDERLTFRSFTLFNFLGEIRQGVLIDFFDKCSKIEYSTKITSIMNYIFNRNIERIFCLKNEIAELQEKIKELEYIEENNKSFMQKINSNLNKLNSKIAFTGYNIDKVKAEIKAITSQAEQSKLAPSKSISELEIINDNIKEQIKVYEKYKSDLKEQQVENKNRELMLNTFNSIISDNQQYNYLVEPLINLIDEIRNSISFSQYILKDDVLDKLKEQQKNVLSEMQKSEAQLTRFSLDDKEKAVVIIEDALNSFSVNDIDENLAELKKQVRALKKELNDLQKSDDIEKINSISSQITDLYKSAKDKSDFVMQDINDTNDTFHIKYIKNHNSLQTMTKNEERKEMQYFTGSLARHTLIQLCGYLVFMKMLIAENKYPVIPIIVIDHISKPFSEQNRGAIGSVLHKACEDIGIDNLQIFMFEDKESDSLNIKPNNSTNLVDDKKTGFNPFFNH